ncbi:MAG: hypothetical protein U5K54_05880 [Cytophagales bacterium]|nr:hypothetical protein [Cytophagales bacterium]
MASLVSRLLSGVREAGPDQARFFDRDKLFVGCYDGTLGLNCRDNDFCILINGSAPEDSVPCNFRELRYLVLRPVNQRSYWNDKSGLTSSLHDAKPNYDMTLNVKFMKNFMLVVLFVVSVFSCAIAQPVLPLDFESTTISYPFTNFLGGAVTKISNPQINGINTSATVAKMIKSPGEVYGGSFITMAAPINFATNKIIKIKVFSPVAGRKLLLKFEGAGPTFEKESIGITTANVWQELTFDFTGVAGVNNVNTKIVFIFDLGTQGDGSANSTYLFDDVVQASNYVGGVTSDYNLVWSDEFIGTGSSR